jgi:thiol-disulfide isomerase/thioredoxin
MTGPDTVDPGEPEGGATPATPPSGRTPKASRLTGRTLAICVCVALVGALAAALVTALVLDDEPSRSASKGDLELAERVDTGELLATGLLTVDGEPTTLAAHLTDRPVVVNLWAQSCVPCVDEMPLLEQAHRDNPDIAFLGVDTQDPRLEQAKRLAEQTGITYPWIRDPDGEFFYAARAAGLPTTLLITPDGEIRARHGVFKTAGQLQRWIDEARS